MFGLRSKLFGPSGRFFFLLRARFTRARDLCALELNTPLASTRTVAGLLRDFLERGEERDAEVMSVSVRSFIVALPTNNV